MPFQTPPPPAFRDRIISLRDACRNGFSSTTHLQTGPAIVRETDVPAALDLIRRDEETIGGAEALQIRNEWTALLLDIATGNGHEYGAWDCIVFDPDTATFHNLRDEQE